MAVHKLKKHDFGFYIFFVFVMVITLPIWPALWFMSRWEQREYEENLKAYQNRPPSPLELLEKRVAKLEQS
jgi:hypothetical protein